MPRLGLRILVLLVPFTVANLWIVHSSHFYERMSKYDRKIDSLDEVPVVRTLICGDSHLGCLDPHLLNSECFNFSDGGDGLKETYLKLAYALELHPEIQNVLISADSLEFSSTRLTSVNASFVRPLLWKTGLFSLYDKSRAQVLAEGVPLFNDDFIGYANEYLTRKLTGRGKPPAPESASATASRPVWSTLAQRRRLEIARERGLRAHAGIVASNRQVEIYRDIVDLCHRKKVRVFGIRTPVTREWAATASRAGDAAAWRVVSEAGLDGLFDFSSRLGDLSLFLDADHCNEEGSRLLIRMIEQDTGLRLAR